MERVQGIEDHGRRSRAGKGGSDLVADVPGFSHAEDDHFPPRFDAFLDQLDRPREIGIEPLAQALELENLDVENFSRLFKIVHGPVSVRRGVRPGKV